MMKESLSNAIEMRRVNLGVITKINQIHNNFYVKLNNHTKKR